MKILLEQVINAGDSDEKRITLIDSTIDNKTDASIAAEAIGAFDSLMLSAGHFTENNHIHLEINGDDIGYAELNDWRSLVAFLGGDL